MIVEQLSIIRVWHDGDEFRVVRHPGNRRPVLLRIDCHHPNYSTCPFEDADPGGGGVTLRPLPWIAVSNRVMEAMALDQLSHMERGNHGR